MAKLLYQGYASILRLVYDRPQDHDEIAAAMGLWPAHARMLMRGFHGLSLVHVAGWRQQASNLARPVYGFGPGTNVPAPCAKNGALHPGVRRPPRVGIELIAFANFVRTLIEPTSVHAAAAVSGVSVGAGYKLVNFMRGLRLVRVADWDRRVGMGGTPTKLFVLDPDRPDEPRPAPEDKRVVVSRYGRRRRARNRQIRLLYALSAAADPVQQLRA